MPRNPHRPGASASNSFSREEVFALLELLAILARGGDPSIVARQPVFRRIAAKFVRMREAIERQGIQA